MITCQVLQCSQNIYLKQVSFTQLFSWTEKFLWSLSTRHENHMNNCMRINVDTFCTSVNRVQMHWLKMDLKLKVWLLFLGVGSQKGFRVFIEFFGNFFFFWWFRRIWSNCLLGYNMSGLGFFFFPRVNTTILQKP